MGGGQMNYDMFETDGDIIEEVGAILDPDDFLSVMVDTEELEEVHEDYGTNVYKLCRNSVGWAIIKLNPTSYIYELTVIEGTFQGKDHAWLAFGDYYVDFTLAQFIKCPRMAVIHKTKALALGYKPMEILQPMDWAREQE